MPDFKEERSGNGGVLARAMITGLVVGVLLGPVTIAVVSVISSIGAGQSTGDAFGSGLRAGFLGEYGQILILAGALIGVFTGAIAGLTWVIARAGGHSVLLSRSLAAVASAIPIILVWLGSHVQGSGLVAVFVTVASVGLVFALSPLVAGRRQRED